MNTIDMAEEGPSLIEAAWKYRLVVLSSIVLFGVFGVLFALLRSDVYEASATVVLDTSTTAASGATEVVSVDRRVANQLEVFKSRVVAERAQVLAQADGVEFSIQEILDSSSFSPVADSDVIRVSFAAEDAEVARILTAAIVKAYQEVRREQRVQQVETILGQLDATETVLIREFADVSGRLESVLSGRALESRIGLVLDQLASAQERLIVASDPVVRDALITQIEQLDRQLRTLELATRIALQQPGVANLVSERDDIDFRLAAVQQLRIQLEAESAAEGSGLAFLSSPAIEDPGGSVVVVVTIAVSLFLGVVVGLALAYAFARTRRSFERADEPEAVLGVPYLADIPRFEDVNVNSTVPVIHDPRSPAAEAFRFVAASLGFRASRADAKIVAFVSGSVGDGKSTMAVNAALAAARSGQRVLLVDADFGNQTTSRLLLGDVSLGAGLSELVLGQARLDGAVHRITAGPDSSLDLLSRGTAPIVAPDLFAQVGTRQAVRRLADHYDLVFLDPPPLLQVAYASNIVQMADAAVVVVSHGTKVRATEELQARLRLIEAQVLGYVYNRAPLRADMLESGGSMKDVLGDAGFTDTVKSRRS